MSCCMQLKIEERVTIGIWLWSSIWVKPMIGYSGFSWKQWGDASIGFTHIELQSHISMACMSSVSYSSMINKELTGSFWPNQGLRQSDFLSSFLFFICAEGLSCLLQWKEMICLYILYISCQFIFLEEMKQKIQ